MKTASEKTGWLLIVGVAAACALYALRPVADPDFWWHLKTGEEMWRSGALLPADPFNFTGDTVLSGRERIILHGYWLWELAYYLAYAVADFPGVVLLNLLLLLMIYGGVTWAFARSGIDKGLCVLLMALSMAVFLPYYHLERPQVCSFLFGLLLVMLFDRFRQRRELSGWLFPLMLLWGNVHGGVLVGCALLVAFLVGTVVQLRADRRLSTRCALWAMCGIGCGFLNPATIFLFPALFAADLGQQAMFSGVLEYLATPQLFREGHYWVICLWLLMLGHALGLFLVRRRWLPDILCFAVLVPASFWYGRNMAFFAVCLLPQTAYYLRESGLAAGRSRAAIWAGGAVLFALLVLNGTRTQAFATFSEPSRFYPVKLAAFVRESGLTGNAFNDYDWGGYLLWSLYPGTRLFWDGRCLDATVYDHARRIRWTSTLVVGDRKEFEVLLDRYGVEYVIQKNISKLGLTEPLMRQLLRRDDWLPVYQDEQGYVLVRAQDKFAPVLQRYHMDKGVFLQNLLELYRREMATSNEPRLFVGRGELLLYLGDLAAARRDLLLARQHLGADDYLDQLLNRAGL